MMNENVVKPKKLERGDKIGIVTVSAPDPAKAPDWYERGVKYLKEKGFGIVEGKHAKGQYWHLAGKHEELAEDINNMFENDKVKAIFCTGGGYNANKILPYLNYEQISKKPKIFMGISNPTTVLNAIYARTGLITFHGPAVVWNFGAENGLTPYTEKYVWKILTNTGAPTEIEEKSRWIVLKDGKACGRLVGGNLISLQTLIGTPYEPNWEGKILFWEDIGKETYRLDAMLTHFKLAGVFDKISGMIIGRLVSCEPKEGSPEIEKIIEDLFFEYDWPIICNVDLGHTDDKLTLPIGCKITIDDKRIILEESTVVPSGC